MTKHEVTLVKGPSSWNLAKDAYDEFYLFEPSPDLQPGSWASLPRRGGPDVPTGPPTTTGITPEPMLSAMATYDRDLAVQCAANNWGPYSSNYNPNYCDFSPDACGGDCTNYVSQCLRGGGMQSDGTCDTVNGSPCYGCGCCKSSAQYAGTVAWIRNNSLNQWLNGTSNPRRGQPLPADPGQCWKGDVINYDWVGSADPNVTDHVTIVVEAGQAPLVASHVPNFWRADYRLGRAINYCQYTRIVSAD